MNDLLINFVPTGMVPTKDHTPHVPIQPNEIIEQVVEVWELGITIVHLHARDGDGVPTHCREVYGRIIEGIRRYAPDLLICVSLSGRNTQCIKQRSDPLRLADEMKPDMGSLTLSSLNFSQQASVNGPDTIKTLAEQMKSAGIIPELEAFDLGMVNYANYLIKRKYINSPCYMNIILGSVAGAQCNLQHMAAMLSDVPQNTLWSFGGIGPSQLKAAAVAIAMGGGVRVGLEDSLRLHGQLTTNRDLIGIVHQLAQIHGRQIMIPQQARNILGMTRNEQSLRHHGRRNGVEVA